MMLVCVFANINQNSSGYNNENEVILLLKLLKINTLYAPIKTLYDR